MWRGDVSTTANATYRRPTAATSPSRGGYHSRGLKAFCGDLNCDGTVNDDDIDPFVLALVDPGAYEDTHADYNDDGSINSLDIDPFVDLLTGG